MKKHWKVMNCEEILLMFSKALYYPRECKEDDCRGEISRNRKKNQRNIAIVHIRIVTWTRDFILSFF